MTVTIIAGKLKPHIRKKKSDRIQKPKSLYYCIYIVFCNQKIFVYLIFDAHLYVFFLYVLTHMDTKILESRGQLTPRKSRKSLFWQKVAKESLWQKAFFTGPLFTNKDTASLSFPSLLIQTLQIVNGFRNYKKMLLLVQVD